MKGAVAAALLLIPGVALAQAPLTLAAWVALDVPNGYESRVAGELARQMPGWEADRLGNLVRTVGEGGPRRLVACALDAPAYAATQITADGYLRVHRIGSGSRHPLWDQAFEAQPVRVLTRTGPVVGVVARANGHFGAQHRDETDLVSADDLWVDVGAGSAGEVEAMGIELLDPIVRRLPPWSFGDEAAGPAAGSRAGCAAVATLATAARAASDPAGSVTFLMSAQQGFGWVGLSAFVARAEPFDRVVVLGPGEPTGRHEQVAATTIRRAGTVLQSRGVEAVTWVAPRVADAGSHVESITRQEAARLLVAAAAAAGLEFDPATPWTPAPAPTPERSDHASPDLTPTSELLDALVDLYAVSGHEADVRSTVLAALPPWARERAVVDDIGNVVVEAGPPGEATVFMAHMDEVGYEVTAIDEDGTVTLAAVGGAVDSAWEGQTALLHFDPEGAPSTAHGSGDDTDPRWKAASLEATAPTPLRGVFLTRDVAETRHPEQMRARFGMDGPALRARGVRPGLAVTSFKDGTRLGGTRFVARGLDDRAGTAALLWAINAIDPDALPGRVIFAWSVHEEGGLIGAGAIARRHGATTRRIYSVDTFVSSDTPLESPHFAHTPLGAGPVLRAIESGGASPDAERDRVREIARAAGIPLQTGLTQGGTDGTWFTFWGAPNQGLSWPGRYSHSPGEVLDLRDLARLGELIAAVAMTGS